MIVCVIFTLFLSQPFFVGFSKGLSLSFVRAEGTHIIIILEGDSLTYLGQCCFYSKLLAYPIKRSRGKRIFSCRRIEGLQISPKSSFVVLVFLKSPFWHSGNKHLMVKCYMLGSYTILYIMICRWLLANSAMKCWS